MSENLNPERPSDSTEDALARVLDELMDGRASRAEAPSHEGQAGAPMPVLQEGCPEPGEWHLLLSGKARTAEPAEEAKVAALLAHAAQCDGCAARLRMLTAEASEAEAAVVGKLASASRDWQHNLAVMLSGTPRQTQHSLPRQRASRWYLWVGASLAASLAIAVAITVYWQQANTPERLLAEAYTHSRIFELRMPGAGFAEVTPQMHLRGSGGGRESAPLLDARARIERQLERAPQDAHWLQLEARADILEENFDPAIDILDRLLAAGPVTSSLLTDDASAYFQRGACTGSENDRATALEYLRHADELAPGDPVVLFNEAIAMEDRGQVMNAVETWNRYLRFERDPRWLADGRRRLQALEQKLNQLKTHQSRMEQHLGTAQAMRALAADPAALDPIDEELSGTLLPRLLDSAFPLPVDCSRGSPCPQTCLENCQAARTLLQALAASLERNHHDPWLTQLLSSNSSLSQSFETNPKFIQAARALAQAIDADVLGDCLVAQQAALKASRLFHALGNAAGEDRAEVERSYALMRLSNVPGCYIAAHKVLGRNPQFAWIQIHDLTQDTLCDPAPGTAAEDNPSFQRAVSLAHDRHYALLELRARNMLGAAAVDTGDTEAAWRDYLPTVRMFYSGDYPAYRLYTTLSGLEEVETATPRVRHTLLLQREVVGVLALSQARELIPAERFKLASAAIRAGSIPEAQEQMRLVESELAANGGGKSVHGLLAENEMDMASLYLDRHDLAAAAQLLDTARDHMAGEHNSYHRRDYAVIRGQLDLTLGHPEAAESMLREALLEEERLAGKGGVESIVLAQQDRALYAVLAGVWLAQGRSGEEVLALWERYRLRILGDAAPVCGNKRLDCLKPRLVETLGRLGQDRLLGQIALLDRLLLYRVSAESVAWTEVPVGKESLLAAEACLERAVTSPSTPMDSVDREARRLGGILLSQLGGLINRRVQTRSCCSNPIPCWAICPGHRLKPPRGPSDCSSIWRSRPLCF